MAKKVIAKFDKKGLCSLGAEKLAEILLDEAAANKPLKLRLQAALAGEGGADKISVMIDKRLDQIEKSKTGMKAAKSRELAAELAGMVRTIHTELGAANGQAAAERMLRLVSMRLSIMHRLYERSARMEKMFDEASTAAVALFGALGEVQQVALVPLIEKIRSDDIHGEQGEIFAQLMQTLSAEAGMVWKALLAKVSEQSQSFPSAVGLLQGLAFKQGDFKEMARLEERKPDMFQNSLDLARVLFDAEQFDDALTWVRRKPKGMHMIYLNGIRAAAGPDYGARERTLLEADILDRLKRRDDAQKLRWEEFAQTFDVDVLRQYISKLDDFAEFDEMDRAMALVMKDKNIAKALLFLVQWPKLDLAAQFILDHANEWDARYCEPLADVSITLYEQFPVAATVLDRALLMDILKRGLSSAYELALALLAGLEVLAPKIEGDASLPSHEQFMRELRAKHGKKYAFWSMVPYELR
ncbi:DUF6880 family protein [Rhizobium sp.]|jgi:hypothetical protein|uniref:DUF6880 family protein n=1 Tax=Rhizobium sp. TaxID=391 RepID=UPI000E8FABB0|nr:hypothetical protein [Rhizobium sp.]